MRAVIQRVSSASVRITDVEGIDPNEKRAISQGFLVLLGVCNEDSLEDV
ncbi:MAG: D-aminoacyl-tRNA deacylase, partial [Bacteroidales bacterium]|nr:D-aminoacyl-tRNA deacylase [Bacteroidales bacterium]